MYFDNAATTFPKPECVYAAMDHVNRTIGVNAGRGSYKVAVKANKIIDELREEMTRLVHLSDSNKVIFSPSITIALNQILNGIVYSVGDYVYISPYEHNAVARTLYRLQKEHNINVVIMPTVKDGYEIDIESLKYQFSIKHPKCICINHMSNVTGYILPIEEICNEAKIYDAITILDTAQTLGLLDVDLTSLQVDFMAFAGHKSLYGPFGIGGFIYNSSYTLCTYITGGTGSNSLDLNMPQGVPYSYESSSPNIVSMAGLLEAIRWGKGQCDRIAIEKELTEYLIKELRNIPNVILYLPEDKKNHIGIISFNIKGYLASDVGMILDEDFDIAVRTGYHCAPYVHRLLKDEEFKGTVRISIGYFNTRKEIDRLVIAIKEIANEV